jgi:hypothetical protein
MLLVVIKMIDNFLNKIGKLWGTSVLVQPEPKPVKPTVRPPVPPAPLKTRVERREYTRYVEPTRNQDSFVDDVITAATISAVVDLFSSNKIIDHTQKFESGGDGDFGGGGASGSWDD